MRTTNDGLARTIIKAINSIIAITSISLLTLSSANAAENGSLYTYNLKNAETTVANTAASNSDISLELEGDFTSDANGVDFNGNVLTGNDSILSSGFANPAGRNTLDVDGSQSFGISAIFSTDTSGNECRDDSQNITQIGFYNDSTQAKLQLGRCNASGDMKAECRIIGNESDGPILRSAERLIKPGETYNFSCIKTADNGGDTQVKMKVININTGDSTTEWFDIDETGDISSDKFLSVGNKHPTPSPGDGNSDQFNGVIAAVSYCEGKEVWHVKNCMIDELNKQDEQLISETITSGVRDSEKDLGPKWTQTSWTSPTDGTVTITHNWDDTDTDMRFRVIDSSSNVVARSKESDQPGVTMTFTANPSSDYTIQVWAKSGDANQTLIFSW